MASSAGNGMTLRNRSLPAATATSRQMNNDDNQTASAAELPPVDDEESQVDPGDSASQVQSGIDKQSSISAKSSRISTLKLQATAKRAQLLARNESLKEMQSLELEEIRLKQKREQLELKRMISEVDAEERAYADNERGVRENVSAVNDNAQAPVITNSLHKNDIMNQPRLLSDEADSVTFRRYRTSNVINDQMLTGQLIETLQLPKVEISSFDGNPLKYWTFIRQFENSVDKLSVGDDARLNRLIHHCNGKARQVIQCCLMMPPTEGYIRAKQLLKQRFGDHYVITESWIKKISEFGVIKPNDKEKLLEFSDELNSCKEMLKAMNRLNEINNQTNLLRIVKLLPDYLQHRWRNEASNIRLKTGNVPSIEDLTSFIERAAFEANDPVFGQSFSMNCESENLSKNARIQRFDNKRKNFNVQLSRPTSTQDSEGTRISNCILCQSNHQLFRCEKFGQWKPEQRLEFVRSKKLCFNCLKSNHRSDQCKNSYRCTIAGCGKKHSKFLHLPVSNSQNDITNAVDRRSESINSSHSAQSHSVSSLTGAGNHTRVCLPIVPVRVRVTGSRQYIDTCALLDGGSTNTFCAEELAVRLGITGYKETLTLTTLDKENSVEECNVVSLNISNRAGDKVYEVPRVFTRKSIPISLKAMANTDDISRWPHLSDVELPNVSGMKVLLLIGQDVPTALMPQEIKQGADGEPCAIKTPFGWTISGPLISGINNSTFANFVQSDISLISLDQQLEKFWKLENSENIADSDDALSVNDEKALAVWNKTVKFKDGHYEVSIPFKQDQVSLPNNMVMAEQRLCSLKRRLMHDEKLLTIYRHAMNDLLKQGYAEKVPAAEVNLFEGPVWYLPHHPVTHPRKPGKVRIVFDCAAKFQQTSLNEQVLQGPDLTNTLIGVLLRFREERIALMADINSMFHQVRVTQADRNVLRFLWWNDGDLTTTPEVFRMNSHLFGGVWSPSCCSYILRKTADDNLSEFGPEVVSNVHRNFYVDDYLKSVQSQSKAVEIVDKLGRLLSKGGFRLAKWITNDLEVLQVIPENDRAQLVQAVNFDTEPGLSVEHVLGVKWDIKNDSLGFQIEQKDKPLTRRGVLSVVSSVFDPLGLVSPVILRAKKIIQELCRRSIPWDGCLPPDLLTSWNHWVSELPTVSEIMVSRCIKPMTFTNIVSVQLHHFSDASCDGYGTVSYVRFVNADGKIHCSIVMAKSRLAPIKQISIPRLELSAATLAVKMDKMLRREFDTTVHESMFWTDSTAVLQYITNEDRRFHTFVANRLSVIHAASVPSQWHHVSTKLNPADFASRGMTTSEILQSVQWFHGPDFLWCEQSLWPPEIAIRNDLANDPEVRKSTQAFATEIQMLNSVPDNIINKIIHRRSSWFRLKCDIAWILRVKFWLKAKVHNQTLPDMKTSLKVSELKSAADEIIKFVQNEQFADEIRCLQNCQITARAVKKSSSLFRLQPVLSTDGLLIVGGRLDRSSLPEGSKHQIILPKKHHIVDLIVRSNHESSGHCGKEHTLSSIRQKYWIIRARAAVRRSLKTCSICRRFNAVPMQQKMSDLPTDRITSNEPPFTSVGIDFFGPFSIKRGRSEVKRYGCIFVCLVIRAVHIEVTHSMDTDSFINALQRFISRRGCPREIRSDNGTNLAGAEKELKRSIAEWNQSKIDEFLKQKDVQWRFNPPAASHMGGIWERQIRSVRKILSVLLKQQIIDDEGLVTLMCIVESIINGRPLTAVSDDHRDHEALTPNHLLLLRAGPSLPPGIFVQRDVYRRRWRQIQYLADVFWTRWRKEYMPMLQQRQKWNTTSRNVQIGDVVLLVDNNAPRNSWSIGRVAETFPGSDGLVRCVKVVTKSSILVRPIHKLCLLEAIDNVD